MLGTRFNAVINSARPQTLQPDRLVQSFLNGIVEPNEFLPAAASVPFAAPLQPHRRPTAEDALLR